MRHRITQVGKRKRREWRGHRRMHRMSFNEKTVPLLNGRTDFKDSISTVTEIGKEQRVE